MGLTHYDPHHKATIKYYFHESFENKKHNVTIFYHISIFFYNRLIFS